MMRQIANAHPISEGHPVVRPRRANDAMKPIPGTYAAVAVLIGSAAVISAALIASLWLLAQAAAWVGHIL